MTHKYHHKLCVSREAIRALERDGLGWGHDLDCGCFHVAGNRPTRGLLGQMMHALQKGAL